VVEKRSTASIVRREVFRVKFSIRGFSPHRDQERIADMRLVEFVPLVPDVPKNDLDTYAAKLG